MCSGHAVRSTSYMYTPGVCVCQCVCVCVCVCVRVCLCVCSIWDTVHMHAVHTHAHSVTRQVDAHHVLPPLPASAHADVVVCRRNAGHLAHLFGRYCNRRDFGVVGHPN